LCFCTPASGVPVITSLTYDTARGVKPGWKTNSVLNTELAIYQNNLTITGTDISDYTGTFHCTVTNTKGGTSSEVGPYEGCFLYSICIY